MITIACTSASCAHALRVIGDEVETERLVGGGSTFHPDKYRCFNCGGAAQCFLSVEVSSLAERALVVTEATPQEAFAALNGMGLPSESTCCAEVLTALFEAQGIKVKGRQLPHTMRYVVDQLTFPDGRTVHLGASPFGALAYRITNKHSYVEEVTRVLHDG